MQLLDTVYGLYFILYTVCCIVYCMQHTVYSLQQIVCVVEYTVYMCCILYIVGSARRPVSLSSYTVCTDI